MDIILRVALPRGASKL
ncbi:hypothetical protein LINPERHAP1_LOCUS16249 [Linum perenne]